LFHHGLQRLHLRKPQASRKEMEAFIQQIPVPFHPQIVLHQFPELLKLYQLGGFHITQYNKHQADEIKLSIAAHQSISISCHSFEEINKLEGYDYYFISPVYNSISKQGYESNFTKEELMKGLEANADKNIVALGGISKENQKEISTMGFYGAALLGGIWSAENPIEEWNKIKKIII
jgi:thiamine-phosphate pyrophosphorylase